MEHCNVIHNFCESRLNNNCPPELLNSYSSLFISIIPFIYGFPKNDIFYNIAILLFFNGFASFYYHYTLSWFGKQGDEISMIMSVFYGLWGLLKLYYTKHDFNIKKFHTYNGINLIFQVLFIMINTKSKYDYLFPIIFGGNIAAVLYYIHNVSIKYNHSYYKNLSVSCVGALCWIISEIHCTPITKYGHVIWHILFPLGFYRLVLDYDKKLTYIEQQYYLPVSNTN